MQTQAINLTEPSLLLGKCPTCSLFGWKINDFIVSGVPHSCLCQCLPGKKNNQNASGIFKLELEPASQPAEAIVSLLRASTARSSVRGNSFCVQFTSSNSASTWVNLAKKHTGRNPPVLWENKDQIHRAVLSLSCVKRKEDKGSYS